MKKTIPLTQQVSYSLWYDKRNWYGRILDTVITYTLLMFCIYISYISESSWWTFFTGLTFVIFVMSKLVWNQSNYMQTFYRAEDLKQASEDLIKLEKEQNDSNEK